MSEDFINKWKDFIEPPKPIRDAETVYEAPKVEEPTDKAITNGDLIAEAIRTKDSVLKVEMERRFLQWCEETHHTPYSAGDKKIWKKQSYIQ